MRNGGVFLLHSWWKWAMKSWMTPMNMEDPNTPNTPNRMKSLSIILRSRNIILSQHLKCAMLGGFGSSWSKGDAASVPGWRLKVESPVDETLPYSAKSVQTTVTARRDHFFFVASLGRNWAISHALHIFMKKWIVSSLIKEEDVTKIGEQKSKTTAALMNLKTSPAVTVRNCSAVIVTNKYTNIFIFNFLYPCI